MYIWPLPTAKLNNDQIPLEDTALDAAKSSIVYAVTNGVASPGRAVRTEFILKNTDAHTGLRPLHHSQTRL